MVTFFKRAYLRVDHVCFSLITSSTLGQYMAKFFENNSHFKGLTKEGHPGNIVGGECVGSYPHYCVVLILCLC